MIFAKDAGDKAIGMALAAPADEISSAEPDQKYRPVAVRLDIHPSEEQLSVAGRYLARLTERRRTRGGCYVTPFNPRANGDC